MDKTALIFPGQGAQKSGMGKDLYENSNAAKRVFDKANKVLNFDITDMCFNGSDEDLMKTINSQPCIVTVEIAAFEALKEQFDISFQAAAGHSLGEYSALYASGAVDLETVLKLIKKRAELMNKAAEITKGSMAAVIGLDDETVNNILKSFKNVYAANFNSPGQVVITGDKEEINANLDKFKEMGAKRVIPLSVSGAFHSPLMKSASDEFIDFVNQFTFKNTKIPVYTNVDAQAETSGNIFKEKLPKQIYSSVLWTQTINNMSQNGINNFIEIGPGKVLSGLNKKINSELKTLNIYDWDSLMSTVSEIREKELV